MNPIDYCQQQAAPPGSPAYYALRYASLLQRPLFMPLLTLRQEWEDTVTQASDPSIAQAKLAWWAQEIATAASADPGRPPTHPATQALATAPGGWLPRLAPLLIAVIDAHREDVEKARYLDFAALQRHFRESSGRIAGILAYCSDAANGEPDRQHTPTLTNTGRAPRLDTSIMQGPDTSSSSAPALTDADLPEWAIALGAATRLANVITLIGDHARHGRIYLPVDDMQTHQVPASDVLNRRYTPAMLALLLEQANRARDGLLAARAAAPAIPRQRRRHHRVLLAEAAMAQRLLDEVLRDGVQVLHQRIALTPVRNLLASWWGSR
ncbi:squalene/phytoene synthase family protein [Robbsia andropogonis]|uniref:squalene/phytoene synthase family protein n=1 Tax=Robbsia andropogonis TaxID=28092 RepID=UPI0004642C00|nr:squalene/phytoene synthase family protein [Robbsia andropogonis]